MNSEMLYWPRWFAGVGGDPMRAVALVLAAMTLVAWRKERGWTQERAAHEYGISTRLWRKYEAGDRVIPQRLVRWMWKQ